MGYNGRHPKNVGLWGIVSISMDLEEMGELAV